MSYIIIDQNPNVFQLMQYVFVHTCISVVKKLNAIIVIYKHYLMKLFRNRIIKMEIE